LLQAWLQRVVNGGGYIAREYALGSQRCDIFVRFFHMEDGQRQEERFVVEIKVIHEHGSLDTTIKDGLEQTSAYADVCKPSESHLIVVDPRPNRQWDEKIFKRECEVRGRQITVWGM
jgi:hypothetical protein